MKVIPIPSSVYKLREGLKEYDECNLIITEVLDVLISSFSRPEYENETYILKEIELLIHRVLEENDSIPDRLIHVEAKVIYMVIEKQYNFLENDVLKMVNVYNLDVRKEYVYKIQGNNLLIRK